MKKLVAGITAIFMMTVSFFGLMLVVAPAANAGTEKVGICHANEGKKGFVYIEVAKDGSVNGHAGAGHQAGADIIPSFSWIEKVNGVNTRMYFAGQNTTKTEAEFSAADCGDVEEEFITVEMPAPTYEPGKCGNPAFEDGKLTIPPAVEGVTVTDVKANGIWSVMYALDEGYVWKTPMPGSDEFEARVWEFEVKHISADDLWVVDSKTGVGGCEMPRTGGGISNTALILGGGAIGAGMLALAGAMMMNRKRAEI